MQVLRRVTCVGGRVGGDWRRRLRGLGGAVGGGMRVVGARVLERARLLVAEPVLMLEGLEGVGVVAGRVHRRMVVGAEAAVVDVLLLLEEVGEAAVVELARCCDLSTLSSDSHVRPPSRSRYGPETVPLDLFSQDGLALPLAERS